MYIVDDMAEPATLQYNLRSGREETLMLLIKLWLSDDTRFLFDLQGSDRASNIGQVSNSESSISESDCETLRFGFRSD